MNRFYPATIPRAIALDVLFAAWQGKFVPLSPFCGSELMERLRRGHSGDS
jgi:hypothetical protein